MKAKKYIILFLFLSASMQTFSYASQERNIYIGDVITLQIDSQDLSADEIAEKFRDFEILGIAKQSGGYLVSARILKVGEHKIYLGGREILIDARSTLDDIDRDDIFEAELRPPEPDFAFYLRIAVCAFAGIFVLSGGYVLLKKIFVKKPKEQNPLELFLHRSASLSEEDENYFVDLTHYFKNYLEALYGFHIIGKTTPEIAGELKNSGLAGDTITEIWHWLAECDRLKFTGVQVQGEKKKEHYTRLLYLVKKII
ncbi:MAG: hypothetical protein FWG34_00500 [Oscillospiraceae bacterium]|nr:hypothetical protein [Oscillospiraceae bacterium]